MKRIIRTLVLSGLAALLLGSTALADWGPKPALTVKLVNAPEELYYLDLLSPGEGENGLSEDEVSQLDRVLLTVLLENVPEGWHACLAQGTHLPIFGKLTSDNGVHHFHYVGVPDTYRILIVTSSGEVWSSETLQRKVLQSSVTVNWESGEVFTPELWRAYAAQFAFTLLPTLIIELAVLLLFGFELKSNFKRFLLVNLLTQGLLALYFSNMAVTHGFNGILILVYAPLELVIAFIEAGLYRKLLRGHTPRRAFVYGLVANAVSAVAGWYLTEPLWRWVVVTLC